MPRLTDALQEINVRIPYRTVISPNATDDEISADLLKLMIKPTRVFVVHMNQLLTSRVFSKAKETGLMTQGYAWILTNGIINNLGLLNETDIQAMQGVIGIRAHFPISEELKTFRSRLAKAFSVSELNIYELRAYDATTALAMAVEDAGTTNLTFSKIDGRNISNLEAISVSEYGPKLVHSLSEIQFKGLAGDYHFIDGELHVSGFEIVNVIGTGGMVVGFWTQKKGLVTKDPITHETKVTGFCIDFFEAATQAMTYDVSHIFIPFGDNDGKPNSNFNDLLYQVYLGIYDAVVGDTAILANRSSYVDFTLPYTTSCVGLVVPLKDRVNTDFTGPLRYQISNIFWFAFSIMSYTASLSSRLTTQQLGPTVTSINNVLAKGEPVGYLRDSFIFGKLRESGFPESRLVPFSSPEKCEELLSEGPSRGGVSAAFMEVPYVRVFLGQYCKKYKMMEVPFDVDRFGFVFPIRSPLAADVSRAILKVAESDKATQLENAWFKNIDETCPDPSNIPSQTPLSPVSSLQLGLDSFWLLFAVAANVCIIVLSRYMVYFLKQNRDILRQDIPLRDRMQRMLVQFLKRDGHSYINQLLPPCPCVVR
ncbi:unnamed protein product [Arabis nemorensis]|uniref:Ionotropic glutamate receptor C-terminal domain-containing protein n=1 Tax=Arabis nemorensis TaxID=586526 RepID=A0A565CAW1_9BRAS|nr:unnamed protein product [Arabis nemorensis]